MSPPMNPSSLKCLASSLKALRRKHRISLNALAQATGISRRTLARIEDGYYSPAARTLRSPKGAGGPKLSPRIAMRLVKLLLPPDQLQHHLDDYTRLSRSLVPDSSRGNPRDPLYKFLDLLYHYPAFLFHRAPPEYEEIWRSDYAPDYSGSLDLLLRSGFGTRNLGARLRAFRLQHDLTLVETADLLGLSKSELHRLERAERQPSPRTRYRILRLLTLPVAAHRAAMTLSPETSGPKGRAHQERLEAAKAFLSIPPPRPLETCPEGPEGFDSDPDHLHRLRYLWLAGSLKTRDLADLLDISQPHLIRLLRGDRRPSRQLRERIEGLTRSL